MFSISSSRIGAVAIVGVTIGLVGCQSTGDTVAQAPATPAPQLAEFAQPAPPPVGQKRLGTKNGEPHVQEVLASGPDMVSNRSSEGCEWTSSRRGFAPALKWSNCSDSSGTHTVDLSDKAYPLKVGKQWSYVFEGENDKGNSWGSTRRCEVQGTETIAVANQSHDVFKVRCEDSWSNYTWYVSPEMGVAVRSVRNRVNRGTTDVWEVHKVENPA